MITPPVANNRWRAVLPQLLGYLRSAYEVSVDTRDLCHSHIYSFMHGASSSAHHTLAEQSYGNLVLVLTHKTGHF